MSIRLVKEKRASEDAPVRQKHQIIFVTNGTGVVIFLQIFLYQFLGSNRDAQALSLLPDAE